MTVIKLTELLPEGLVLVAPDGLKQGEVWLHTLRNDNGPRILAVCDCFFNMCEEKSFLIDKAFRLANTYPGLRVSRVFSMTAVADKVLYTNWLRKFFAQNFPTLLIPSHGAIYESESLSQELMAL